MARWHSCNVLQPGGQVHQLWQFSAKFALQRQEPKRPTEPLPAKIVGKDWQTLFRPKLNIAWLASDKVFLRVVRSEEHTSELQSHSDLVCRLLLEKKKIRTTTDPRDRRMQQSPD